MRPEYTDFKLITPEGTTDLPVNVNSVISIMSITVPGLLKGPDGSSIAKAATGLDVGFRIIPVDHNPEVVRAMLEGKGNDALTKTLLEGQND